jgi:hypothetical protein
MAVSRPRRVGCRVKMPGPAAGAACTTGTPRGLSALDNHPRFRAPQRPLAAGRRPGLPRRPPQKERPAARRGEKLRASTEAGPTPIHKGEVR